MKILTKIKKYLLIFAGSLSLVLGIIGIFLPVLPTTPFLLLAAYCYMRSSKSLYQWLIHHKVFGVYIYNYITYKAIPKRTKIFVLLFLWSTILISIILVPFIHVRLFLLVVVIAVSIHLLSLKTLRKEDLRREDDLHRVEDLHKKEEN